MEFADTKCTEVINNVTQELAPIQLSPCKHGASSPCGSAGRIRALPNFRNKYR